MLNNYIKLIHAAIAAGVHINSFCIKHRALKGALRSMIFKLWQRCRLLAIKNNKQVVVKFMTDKLDITIVEIVKHPFFSVGTYHALSYLKHDAELNNYDLKVIL